MTNKNPISTLQELMAARRLPLPVYIEEGFGTSFKCTAHAAGVSAVGISTSKKNAKHESAKNVLAKLGTMNIPQMIIMTVPSNTENKPLKNYIGQLNEYSSKHSFKYPDYDFVTANGNGEFYFKCLFLGKEVLGKGMNRKDAKQDSAKKMLELLESMKPIVISETYKIKRTSTNFTIADREKVISMYEALTLKESTLSFKKCDNIKEVPEIIAFERDSIDELKAKLRLYGINYTLTQLQSDPFVMCVRITNTDLYFIQSDFIRDEATRKVLRDVVEASKSGCSLDNDLISLS